MELNQETITQFEEVVLNAKNILLLTHKNPDGDALGSMLALYFALDRVGKKVTPACADPAPEIYKFLPGSERIVNEFSATEFDLVIVLDCGDTHQTKLVETKPELWDGSRTVIKIDHHALATDWGDIKIVHPEVCATSFILTNIFEKLGVKIRPDMATCLLTGLSTDTGSFKHSNTDPEVLRMAAQLLKYGANLPVVSKNIYRTTPISTMKLWGRILNTLKQTKEGVTLAVAQKKDFIETNANEAELAGVVDYVNAVPNAKFSILLSERNGQVKASLRTQREDVDTAKIASAFGGGGHVKASGFAIPGRLEQETVWKVVKDDDS